MFAPIGGPARQAKLEEPPQVAGEGGDHQGHGDQEPGLLELDTPADDHATGLQGDQRRREDGEGGEDAAGRGDEAEPHCPVFATTVADDAQQLD